ncbi:sorting nexin-19 [Chanos chanos]|uniref:Sorting nexin-19 n=1 Tax=Chanos chanos TaxID=29144 RepID=A0A6J2VLC2_CHACN|nr:sorting nexin-19 [Chanos chanos]
MSQHEAPNPGPWALSELLGQRRLLGFGMFLGWMILFHLLVNVWLLCLFTSLLVVLGGWLGSQAVLDSKSVVHLERFVRLERIPPSAESEQQLDHEIHNTVCKIIRDFVSSWYSTVSSEREFEIEVQNAMVSMAMELKVRARRIDRKRLTQRVLNLCGCHLHSYLKAKELMVELEKQGCDENTNGSLWKVYSKSCTPHPALKSSAAEINYARAIVDLLLHVLVPVPHLETRTGRFVVGELITCNVLLPLISKLSDPDWLNMLIVDSFTKSSEPASKAIAPVETPPPAPPPLPLPPQLVVCQEETQRNLEIPSSLPLKVKPDKPVGTEGLTPELAAYDVIDATELYCPPNVEEEPKQTKPFTIPNPGCISRDYLRPGKSNPFYQETDSDLDSPLIDFKKSSMESLVLIGSEEVLTGRLTECPTPTDSVLDLEDEVPGYSNLTGASCPKLPVSEQQYQTDVIADTPALIEEPSSSLSSISEPDRVNTNAEKEMMGVEQSGPGNPNELSVTTPLQTSSPTAGVMSLSSFNFEPLNSPEGPVIIQNLRITGTITAKEHRGTGSHPYTLYTVKYETAVDSDNPGSLQPVAYHMVNRRYSEFLNLQTRLEEKPELRKILKNVKGPKKIFPDLPFGNMDSDKVEARKSLLETFLKQLCAIPETANSEEMQEFLALNTDARIAFVKKPFIVSRIDKIVVNAIVDTLKTAFPRSEPQSPTDDMDTEPDGKATCDKKSKSRMRFSSKIAPALNVSDMKPKVLYCFDEGSTVFNGLSMSGLENFIAEQERLTSRTAVRDASGEREGILSSRAELETCGCPRNDPLTQNSMTEMVLADTVLDILCLLMKDQWGWLCTENIQKSIRLLFGTLIDRWLEVGLANLTSMQYWVFYLRVVQEAIWPGGNLPTHPRPERSQQLKEETKQQCLQCLMKLLPDLVTDVLGSEKYRNSWQIVLESLQDPSVNRHLVYSIWDLLLEFLVPEVSDEDFQKTLLQSLSKNAEKLPP